MMQAADRVSTGLITYAARDSEYDGKRIRKGEIMALENGRIVSTSSDLTKATTVWPGLCAARTSSFVTIISWLRCFGRGSRARNRDREGKSAEPCGSQPHSGRSTGLLLYDDQRGVIPPRQNIQGGIAPP